MMLAVSPAAARVGILPPTIEQGNIEEFDKLGWFQFQNLLVIQDRYTHPDRLSGFMAADHGDMWRHAEGCARWAPAWPAGQLAAARSAGCLAAWQIAALNPTHPTRPGQPHPTRRFVSSNWTIGFFDPDLAHDFRDTAYEHANWPLVELWEPPAAPQLPKVCGCRRGRGGGGGWGRGWGG
jgi:hypothetical protein